jgi:hypothetical protein
MAELVDAPDLGSGFERSRGSSPLPRTAISIVSGFSIASVSLKRLCGPTADQTPRARLAQGGRDAVDARAGDGVAAGVVLLGDCKGLMPQAGGYHVAGYPGLDRQPAMRPPETMRRNHWNPGHAAEPPDMTVYPVPPDVSE